MPNYVVYTRSDPVAGQILRHLETRGFTVFDQDLASAATLLVFDTTRRKLKKAIKDMNLMGPYRISIAKVDKDSFFMGFKDMENDVDAIVNRPSISHQGISLSLK